MDLVDILAGLGPDNLAEKRKALMQWRINSAMGMLAPTTGTGVEAATRMLPMTGEAWTANDAGNAIQEGQYGKAAMMGLLGLLPLGGMMSAGLRAGATVPKRMGQSGAIAWHGSPHKFDKFSLDKIGTGEGAQAYGHGLYLAESPEVAKSYAENLANRSVSPSDLVSINGKSLKEVMASAPPMARAKVTSHIVNAGGDVALAQKTLDEFVEKWKDKATLNGQSDLAYAQQWMKQLADQNITFKPKPAGELYKTDIPDEAVARFLDWDKPLSQQPQAFKDAVSAREQQRMMPILEQRRATLAGLPQGAENASILKKQIAILEDEITQPQAVPNMTGGEYFNYLRNREMAPAEQADWLRKAGIPGIRYLDGGSRGAGQGSSNFVAFDPELIRILERNGIPTGNQPWKPGEWQGMLSGTK